MSQNGWRFLAQRIVSGEWLDNDVQFTSCPLTYNLSAANSAQGVVAMPGVEPLGSDGRPVWGKWDTMLFAEFGGNLDSAYIVDSVSPGPDGAKIGLIGLSAWLARVDYSGNYQVWETNTFDAVRELLSHANGKPRGLTFHYPGTSSSTTVGDPEPPAKPVKPPRHKGESKAAYAASTRFTAWEAAVSAWNTAYAGSQKYKVVFWETPFVGDEFNSLAQETGFDWREQYTWDGTSGGFPVPKFTINFADDLSAARSDIIIEEGVNVQGRLNPTDDDQTYVNKILGIGAGQGRKTLKVTSTVDDGRLYAADFLVKKHQKNAKQLKRSTDAQVKRRRKIDPQIGSVDLIDAANSNLTTTLKPGDILPVRSTFVSPHISTHAMIRSITVDPFNPGRVRVDLETLAP